MPWVWEEQQGDLPVLRLPKTMLLPVSAPNKSPNTDKLDFPASFLDFWAPLAFGDCFVHMALSQNKHIYISP